MIQMTQAKWYSGVYQRTDIPYPLLTQNSLQINEKFIFGVGRDPNGFYVAHGTRDKDTVQSKKGDYKNYNLVVSYIGKFDITHNGSVKKENGVHILSGFWVNEALRIQGAFSLKEGAAVQSQGFAAISQVQAPVNQGNQMLMKSVFGGQAFNIDEYKRLQGPIQLQNNFAPQNNFPPQSTNPFAGGFNNSTSPAPMPFGAGPSFAQPVASNQAKPDFQNNGFNPNNKVY